MKAIKYIFASAILTVGCLSFSSCSDLEENPKTFLNPSNYYNNEDEVQSALVGVYNRLRNMYTANSQLYIANLELYTEQGWPTYNKNSMEKLKFWYDINNASIGNSDRGVNRIWSAAYEAINRANIVLARHQDVTMSETSHNRIEGQAKFIRAYAYWHLIRLFGRVPVITTHTIGLDGLEVPRNTLDESYEIVINDLTDAIKLLPKRGEDSSYDIWRATKGAAQALLGEVYLYRATIDGSNNTQYLQLAKQLCSDVMTSGAGYDLMENFTDQYYWFNANAKNNKESLFELQFAPLKGQSNDMHIRFGLGRTYSYMGCYMYARMGVSGFLYKEMKDNGDKRADALLTHFKLNDGTSCDYDAENFRWVPEITNDRSQPHRCVFNCKYFDNRTAASLNTPNANFPMLRYAEVLLNYAEAANLLKAGDGLTELNRIRTRAGLEPYTFTTQAAMDEEIFQQRRFEFVGEGKIFYDELRRGVLGQYASNDYKRGHALGITYFNEAEDVAFKAGRNFLFKIPQSDLDSNPALEQNPDN